MLSGLGEGDVLGLSGGSEVLVVRDVAAAGEGPVYLAGDGAFERTEDGLLGPAAGEVGVAVGAGGGVVAHPDFDDVVQGGVRGAVAAPGQPVAVGAPGADRDGRGAAQGGERGRRAEPVGVVAGGDQQLGADDGADAFDGQQGRVGGGDAGLEAFLDGGDLVGQVTVPPGQGPQGRTRCRRRRGR